MEGGIDMDANGVYKHYGASKFVELIPTGYSQIGQK